MSMIDSIFPEPKIRKWVQKMNLSHFVYLLVALITNLFIAYIWTLISITKINIFGIFGIFVCAYNGFLAYLFMHYQIKFRLIYYSILFSLLSAFIVKYLFYMHIVNWTITTMISKDDVGISLFIKYMQLMRGENLIEFLHFARNNFGLFDIIIVIAALLSPFQYILFDEDDDDEQQKTGNWSKSAGFNQKRMMKKRFDF